MNYLIPSLITLTVAVVIFILRLLSRLFFSLHLKDLYNQT